MTSLADVYEGEAGRVASRRQQLVGTGLFLFGVTGLVGAIALATTEFGQSLGLSAYAAREVAGVVAGLGLPAVVLGIFAVLPADPRIRVAAGAGAGVSLVGVALFQHLYPYNWVTNAPLLALVASTVYFAGVVTTFWCLFVALATFKTRNDPGGAARMEVTEEGTIKLVEESPSFPGLGGIGFFGQEPDGGVETQTNRQTTRRNTASDGGDGTELFGSTPETTETTTDDGSADDTERHTHSSPAAQMGPSEHDLDPVLANAGPEASPSTDGGTSSAIGRDPITETAVHQGEPDRYCGNCRHFQYVMDGEDIEPYCTFHEEQLDDMEACSAWVDND